MNLDDTFPLKLMINLSRREDRRFRMDLEFLKLGLEVERLPAVNAKYVRRSRGYPTARRYANALSHRLAIRRAKLAGAPAVLIFEDDVVFAPDFLERLEQVELPEDWGIFYLGCRHWEPPQPAAPGLVKVTRAMDAHAYAVRAAGYEALLRAFRRPAHPARYRSSVGDWGVDFPLADMQTILPAYGCWPNLAWQLDNDSDLVIEKVQAYDEHGHQTDNLHAVAGLDLEMARLGAEAVDRLSPPAEPLRLHLGCGGRVLEGWRNLDLPEGDIREPLRCASGSAQAIFLEHVIGHVTPAEAWRFFDECRRALRPDGVLRVSFPCVEQTWRRMTPEFAAVIQGKGWGNGSARTALRSLIIEHGHQAAWTAGSLRAVLEAQGFEVTQHAVGESNDPCLRGLERHGTQVGAEANAIETVCLEARKGTSAGYLAVPG